jgi:ribonuclease HI
MSLENGLVGIRYSTKEGATVYRASSKNIQLSSEPSKPLDQGESASKLEDSPKQVRKKFGSSHSRTTEQKSAAQKDVRAYLEGLSSETIRCFTDGSCVGNPGPCGTGVYIQLPAKEIKHYRYLGEGTNNKAELSAVLDAMQLLESEGIDKETPVVVCTDSTYVVGILTQNWKAKANKEIISPLRAAVKQWNNITIRWVAGHADIPENDEADRLANLAIAEGRA